MKTYDIYFSDEDSYDNKGFSLKTMEKAIHMAEDMLEKEMLLLNSMPVEPYLWSTRMVRQYGANLFRSEMLFID